MQVRSVEAVVEALNTAEVRYLIVGGLAVNAHGYVRMTRDLDLVIQLVPDNILRGLKALIGIGYQLAIPAKPEEFADRTTRVRWKNERNMIVLKLWSEEHSRTPIDVFIEEPFNFVTEHERAVWMDLGEGRHAPFVALPALLDMKRAAGRPQDLVDIAELERER